MSTFTLVFTAVGSVLLLLFLVMKARMHAFVALMLVSIGAGIFSGMPLDSVKSCMKPAHWIRLLPNCSLALERNGHIMH